MTKIWGVLNVTPDSFSDGGLYLEPQDAVHQGLLLIAQGADAVDIGGESTRPGAERVAIEEEQRRVLRVIEALVEAGVPVSIDTMNASTARAAVAAGAQFVNDVSGGLADPEMLAAVAETEATFVVGHWRGPSADMYARAEYEHVGREVAAELAARVDEALAAGIRASNIMIDPGFGFAKTPQQSWALLHELADVVALGYPVLVGTSRKRFLRERIGDDATLEQLDALTAETSVTAAHAGAAAVRVHDVASTKAALTAAGFGQPPTTLEA